MKIKEFKILILIMLFSFFMLGCNTVQKAFDPQRKNSSEEFLVEKKAPLSMPPNFGDLPVPKTNTFNNGDDDIEQLILDNQKNLNNEKDTGSTNKDFEEFMLDKIKKN